VVDIVEAVTQPCCHSSPSRWTHRSVLHQLKNQALPINLFQLACFHTVIGKYYIFVPNSGSFYKSCTLHTEHYKGRLLGYKQDTVWVLAHLVCHHWLPTSGKRALRLYQVDISLLNFAFCIFRLGVKLDLIYSQFNILYGCSIFRAFKYICINESFHVIGHLLVTIPCDTKITNSEAGQMTSRSCRSDQPHFSQHAFLLGLHLLWSKMIVGDSWQKIDMLIPH